MGAYECAWGSMGVYGFLDVCGSLWVQKGVLIDIVK